MASKRSNGEGSIYKNAARGRWEGLLTIVRPDGKRVRRKVSGKTKAEAREKLEALRRQLESGAGALDRTMTVAELASTWRSVVLPRLDVRPSTKRSYGDAVTNYILPTWGTHKIASFGPLGVEDGLSKLAGRGLSRSTVRTAKVVLGMVLAEAERNDLIARNPVTLARMPKMAKPTPRRAMSQAQVQALLTHLEGTRLLPPVILALATGLRPGEVLALRWEDLDLVSDVPTLRVVESKTDRGRRTLTLVPRVVEALDLQQTYIAADAEYLDDAYVDEGWVFPSTAGTKWDINNYRKLFQKACQASGIGHWTLHELRHTAGSWLMAQGLPLKFVSDTLGHSSVSITADIYGHLLAPPTQIADAFSALLRPVEAVTPGPEVGSEAEVDDLTDADADAENAA